MPLDRYFIDAKLRANDHHELSDDQFRHLARVMRRKVEDDVELVNGRGQLARARIADLDRKGVVLVIRQVVSEGEPSPRVIVAQAIPRGPRLATILEKGSELGMTDIWLFPGERSERDETSYDERRSHSVLVAALKQCGRLYLPRLVIKPPLAHWSSLPKLSFFGSLERDAKPLFCHLSPFPPADEILIVIGPEGGLSPKEITHLRQLGATGVWLHPNVLRTDTAPLVALALITHLADARCR